MNKPKLNLDEFKNLSPEEIRKLMAESAAAFVERKKKEKEQLKDERTGQCVVCRGTVVARVTREYRGDPRHAIIGPGYRNQLSTTHHGFHCTSCGLKYEFPPPEKKRTTNNKKKK